MTATIDTAKTISRDLLQDVLEMSDIYNFDTVNDTYSGRNMNGATCLSFVIEGHWGSMRRIAAFMAALAATQAYDVMINDGDEHTPVPAQDMANVLSVDDLGMDTIVYFPGWTLAAEEPTEDPVPLMTDEVAHVNAPLA